MFENIEDYGFSTLGLFLAFLCCYVLFGKLVGMYVFDNTGSTGMRKRLMVQVVVLGDIGRSPRMRYHATSLADSGCTVDLIGYKGKYIHTYINPPILFIFYLNILVKKQILVQELM
ncbi:hypothetical protein BD770DRAFT_101876 [Pilaira anomala]|nr:hypothetical protein BD770DRAFT_101876 [Pilaira anomala]